MIGLPRKSRKRVGLLVADEVPPLLRPTLNSLTVDQIAQDLDQKRLKDAFKAWGVLWENGDWSKAQGRIFEPEEKKTRWRAQKRLEE